MIFLIAIGAFVATLAGGLCALRLQDRLHLVLGFSAGAIIGVAFFDLLPEALALTVTTYDSSVVTAVIALGFLMYLALDRFLFTHHHEELADHHEHHDHDHQHAHTTGIDMPHGMFSAGSLALHSFLDGVAIGLAFSVSPNVGIIVATAVLVHDFSDGINTVSLILKSGGSRLQAFLWLTLDALAPVIGIVAASFLVLPKEALGLILAIFCGFFLYIGASELLPESYHSHPKTLTTVMTILGMAVMYGAILLAGV
jgi:zinc transporter ZupT